MRRSLKNLLVILMMSFVLISGQMAYAIGPLPLFMAFTALNDMRQKPIVVETPGINPQYSVYSGGFKTDHGDFVGGKFEGVCLDPRTQVAASARGTTMVWDFGITASGDIGGVEVVSSSPYFFNKVGVYEVGYAKKFTKAVKFQIATDRLITSDEARFGKWQISFRTDNLPTGAYQLTVNVWNKQGRPVFFGLGRESDARKTPVVCRFLILNAEEIAEAANNIQVQKDLAVTYGLIAGPPQFGQRQILVNPSTVAGLQREGLLPPQPGQLAERQTEPTNQSSESVVTEADGTVSVATATATATATASTSVSSTTTTANRKVYNRKVTIVFWKGTEKKVVVGYSVNDEWFKTLVSLTNAGQSQYVTLKSESGDVVASTEATAKTIRTNNSLVGTVEFHIYRGSIPTVFVEFFPEEEN